MKIKFGNMKPTVLQNYEIVSPNGCIHIKKKYWQTYNVADEYAKILRQRHDHCAFAVKWCKPFPQKPIRILKDS
jgi:hypothetical protein